LSEQSPISTAKMDDIVERGRERFLSMKESLHALSSMSAGMTCVEDTVFPDVFTQAECEHIEECAVTLVAMRMIFESYEELRDGDGEVGKLMKDLKQASEFLLSIASVQDATRSRMS